MAKYNATNQMLDIPDGTPTGAGGIKLVTDIKVISDCFVPSSVYWSSGSNSAASTAFKCKQALLADQATSTNHASYASTAGYAYSAGIAMSAYSLVNAGSPSGAVQAGYANTVNMDNVFATYTNPLIASAGYRTVYDAATSTSTRGPVAIYGSITLAALRSSSFVSGSGSGVPAWVPSGSVTSYASIPAYGSGVVTVQACSSSYSVTHFAKITFYIRDRVIRGAIIESQYTYSPDSDLFQESHFSIIYQNVNPTAPAYNAGYYAYINNGVLYMYLVNGYSGQLQTAYSSVVTYPGEGTHVPY